MPTVADVLHWISERLKQEGRELEGGLEVDMAEFIQAAPPGDARVAVNDALSRAHREYGYIEPRAMGTLWTLKRMGADQIARLREERRQHRPQRRKAALFLTHAAGDKSLALRLKKALEERIRGLEVFVSSDPSDLPIGEKWPDIVQENLAAAGALLLLTTRRALARPWVWFELGTAWFLPSVPKTPLCFGEVRKNALPAPLTELQGANGEELEDLKDALNRIAVVAGLRADTDNLEALRRELVQLESELAAKHAGGAVSDVQRRKLGHLVRQVRRSLVETCRLEKSSRSMAAWLQQIGNPRSLDTLEALFRELQGVADELDRTVADAADRAFRKFHAAADVINPAYAEKAALPPDTDTLGLRGRILLRTLESLDALSEIAPPDADEPALPEGIRQHAEGLDIWYEEGT